MLRADLVEGALVSAFQHRPERLDPVGVGHAVDVLADAVLHGFVLERHSLISTVIVGVNRRAFGCMITDETLQCLGICFVNNTGRHHVAVTVFHTNHGGLADCAAPGARQLFALCLAHILALAAEIGLIDLYRAVKLASSSSTRPCLPDTVQHEPRRRLRNANVALQLHGRNRLEVCQAEVNRNRPLTHRDFRPLHGGARLDAEIGPAIACTNKAFLA